MEARGKKDGFKLRGGLTTTTKKGLKRKILEPLRHFIAKKKIEARLIEPHNSSQQISEIEIGKPSLYSPLEEESSRCWTFFCKAETSDPESSHLFHEISLGSSDTVFYDYPIPYLGTRYSIRLKQQTKPKSVNAAYCTHSCGINCSFFF